MPTIIYLFGWKISFFSCDGKEPIHVHVRKGEKIAKYWLDEAKVDIDEVYSINMSPQDKRTVRVIIMNNFDSIIDQWKEFFEGKDNG